MVLGGTRFPYEISCYLVLALSMRFHEICLWVFMLFGPNEISLWASCFLFAWFSYDTSFEFFDQGSSAFFFCALTVNIIDLLFFRQYFIRLRKLVHHRFAAIRGAGVQHRISLRLCQLTFARVLLEHIVHRARWRRQLPWRALQGLIAQKGQQQLHRVLQVLPLVICPYPAVVVQCDPG
jgi:hypothetical protein